VLGLVTFDLNSFKNNNFVEMNGSNKMVFDWVDFNQWIHEV
jgi:hypothetical protein